jgi:hypothetical protein
MVQPARTSSRPRRRPRPTNQDCLFLNVWTPEAGKGDKRPVMLWFHGGGYGQSSPQRFGYLNPASRFGNGVAASGNVGNLDLVRSLEWQGPPFRAAPPMLEPAAYQNVFPASALLRR